MRISSILAMFVCLLSSSVHAHEETKGLQVIVSWNSDSTQPRLEFEISNRSSRALTLGESSLPWKDRHSIVIIGKTKTKGILPSVNVIEDRFRDERVPIQPGETLKGAVDLDLYVGQIEQALTQSEVLIFWFYEPETFEGRKLGRFGGWVVIPRRK